MDVAVSPVVIIVMSNMIAIVLGVIVVMAVMVIVRMRHETYSAARTLV